MPGCNIADALSMEGINHEPKYIDEYYEMDDDELERMSRGKEQSMLADPAGEEQWQEDLRTRQGDHFKNCDDPDCVRLCNNWRGESTLSKYVS